MAAQPTEEDIDLMCSLTNITRSEAISRLKNNNNDVTQASNEYFDNPGSNPYTWDESQFHSDRDGSTNKAGISFQVQGPDDHGRSGYLSGAPSRPPSRTSNKSPLGRTVSLADRQQDGSSEIRMTTNEFDDVELQKALAESAQESGLPPQEYGITNPNGVVHFGPANRDNYNDNDWQMVHIPNASTSPLSHPAAEDRKRNDGAPAFLKPNADGNRLASIISIYHEIPLAREIFLRRLDLLLDYGYDPEWWAGKAIGRIREGRRSIGGDLVDSTMSREGKELFHELQRLMAFLDKTDRSYGSAEPLANMALLKKAPPDDLEGIFFEAWKHARRDNPSLPSIFSKAIQPTGEETDKLAETNVKEFAILDLTLPNTSSEEYATIYDLTDRILWAQSGLDIGTSAYLIHVADVIGFRLVGNELSRSVTIPELWFPDRYLEAGREAALDMRRRKAEIRDRLMNICNLENVLKFFTLPDGKRVNVGDIFHMSLMHDSEPSVEEGASDVGTDGLDADMDTEPLRVGDKINVSAELQTVMVDINKKMEVLGEEKRKALTSLHDLSKLFTQDHKDQKQSRLHKYKLCGLSTTKETTYIRKQAEPDLIDMDLDPNDSESCRDQWWRVRYTMADEKPVSAMKVTLEDVLNAAMTESKTAVVVYASERAMAEPVKPLPASLEAFVRADNLAFSAEFSQVELQDSQSSVASPVSPGKRKYDESSEESVEVPPRYTEPRWGSRSPLRDDGVVVSHQEVEGSDDGRLNGHGWPALSYESSGESITPRGSESHDVIMGQDPNELAGLTFETSIRSESQPEGRKIQEKGKMPTLLSRNVNDAANQSSAVDSMDVDQVFTDEAHVSGMRQIPLATSALDPR